ncbi:MAG: hypothetical protein HYY44_02130 [Deltaproteobacteria bacterium]|nr:hypothetical protein [Deltaproteobacteria bacterium]MBI4373578.1 hypothetical protein [Deltaproteobacteria bacterium]
MSDLTWKNRILGLLARHVEIMGSLPEPGHTLVLPHRFVGSVQHAVVAIRDVEQRLFEEGTTGWAEQLRAERNGLQRLETGLRRIALFTDVRDLGVGSLLEVRVVRTDIASIVTDHDQWTGLVDQLSRRHRLASWLSRSGKFPDRLGWPHVYYDEIVRRMRGINPLESMAVAAAATSLLLFLSLGACRRNN